MGDIEFADDTMIMGRAEEQKVAEQIFLQTLLDWGEKPNVGKTERLRISAQGRRLTDVRMEGEEGLVRHIGSWLPETGYTEADTRKRVTKGRKLIGLVTLAWSKRTKHGRGRESGMDIPTRLQVMRNILVPAITCFSRSRALSAREIDQLQRVANYAVRRCMGIDTCIMEETHISDEMMYIGRPSGTIWVT